MTWYKAVKLSGALDPHSSAFLPARGEAKTIGPQQETYSCAIRSGFLQTTKCWSHNFGQGFAHFLLQEGNTCLSFSQEEPPSLRHWWHTVWGEERCWGPAGAFHRFTHSDLLDLVDTSCPVGSLLVAAGSDKNLLKDKLFRYIQLNRTAAVLTVWAVHQISSLLTGQIITLCL